MIYRVFLSRQRIPRHRRDVRGGSQPRRADHNGSSTGRGLVARKTKALQSSRRLPDDGAALEPVDDRTGDVAVVSATSEAETSQGSS